MPLTPLSGAVDTALRFKLQLTYQIWMCIGRTTPWPDENNPPDETDVINNPQYFNMLVPEEPIAYKRIDFASLVVPDSHGEVIYRDQRYSYVPDSEALIQMAHWCFVRSSINHTERNSVGTVILGPVTYRQVTFVSGLVPLPAFVHESILLPAQVQDPGRVIFVVNFTPVTHDVTVNDIIFFVREFRG